MGLRFRDNHGRLDTLWSRSFLTKELNRDLLSNDSSRCMFRCIRGDLCSQIVHETSYEAAISHVLTGSCPVKSRIPMKRVVLNRTRKGWTKRHLVETKKHTVVKRGRGASGCVSCVDIDGTFLVRWFAFYRTMPTIVRPSWTVRL